MARLTITQASATGAAALGSLEEANATLTSTLATLVADGASPTQAHVTAVNNAQTAVAAILANPFVVFYDRATLTSPNLISAAFAAALAQALNVN